MAKKGSKQGQIQFKGTKELQKAFDKNFQNPLYLRNIGVATKANVLVGVKAQRKVIQGGTGLVGNRPLTKDIKGGNKPLVDTGSLFLAITGKVISSFLGFSGVLRSNKSWNIARGVIKARTVRVSKKMRNMFWLLANMSDNPKLNVALTGRARELWNRSRTKQFIPIASGTARIRYKGRPYVRMSLRGGFVRRSAETNWRDAIKLSMKDTAAYVNQRTGFKR